MNQIKRFFYITIGFAVIIFVFIPLAIIAESTAWLNDLADNAYGKVESLINRISKKRQSL